MVESGKTLSVPFNIFTGLKYHHVKVVSDEATVQTLITSLGQFVKKLMCYPLMKSARCWIKRFVNPHLHLI